MSLSLDSSRSSVPVSRPASALSEVLPNVFVTNFFSARNRRLLLSHGITHILVAAFELDCPFPDQFEYCKLPIMDIPSHPITEQLQAAIQFIHSALSSTPSKANNSACAPPARVLIHCAAGVSRSASIAIAYRMWLKRLTFDAALEETKLARPSIDPNWGFREQLTQWGQNGWKIQENQVKRETNENGPTNETHANGSGSSPVNDSVLPIDEISDISSSSLARQRMRELETQVDRFDGILDFLFGSERNDLLRLLERVKRVSNEVERINKLESCNGLKQAETGAKAQVWLTLQSQKQLLDSEIDAVISAIQLRVAGERKRRVSQVATDSPLIGPRRARAKDGEVPDLTLANSEPLQSAVRAVVMDGLEALAASPSSQLQLVTLHLCQSTLRRCGLLIDAAVQRLNEQPQAEANSEQNLSNGTLSEDSI